MPGILTVDTDLDAVIAALEDLGYTVVPPTEPTFTLDGFWDMTECAGRMSPPSHYSDYAAQHYLQGRDDAVEFMREEIDLARSYVPQKNEEASS